MAYADPRQRSLVPYTLFGYLGPVRRSLLIQLLALWALLFGPTASADVIYKVTFDGSPLGTYGLSAIKADWRGVFSISTASKVSIVGGSEAKSGRSLRVFFGKESYLLKNGGALWRVRLPKKYDELYLAYWIKFQSGFEYSRGGKIPGLFGGTSSSGCGTYNKPDGTNGWSARMMWYGSWPGKPAGSLAQYVYHPDMSTCGTNMWYDLGGQRAFKLGVWHRVVHRIKMNTPGKKDGIVQAWFDGVMALDRRNIRFRDVTSLAIDGFTFNNFFGGSDDTWASPKDQYIYYDDFVISTTTLK